MTGRRLTIALALTTVLLPACGGDGAGTDDSSNPSGGPVNLDCESATETLDTYLIIESEDDLAALNGLREITGELQIDKTSFTDLSALGCIEEVGDDFTIFGNTALTDLSGLASLTRVRGAFIFSENTAVTDFDGANALTEVGGSVIIQDNAAMTGVSGLTTLDTIEGALNIRSNDSLTHIDGLGNRRTGGGQLAITQNPNLCISSVNRVGSGITDPAVIPDNWSTRSNDDEC